MGNSTKPAFDNPGGTVPVKKRGWLRRLFAFAGPAYLISVGYMDPGNWATDIEGGARFGYTLIWVLLMSNIMAVLLQTLAARLGIVTGYDLAQGCRKEYSRPLNLLLWIMAEIAIAATDLAELLGTVIGLNLLFGLPMMWGCVVTAFDTFIFLGIQRLGVRKMEAFIVTLVATIGASFLIEIFLAQPDWGGIAAGFVPGLEPGALFVSIGIIGATVMPHNLYLHSSLVQSRAVSSTHTGKAEACKFNLIDSAVALNAAFFVNAAILVMAAADFHSRGILVTEIQQAHQLLQPLLGTAIAPIAFAVALVAAGQSSTLTGTLSGQIVMEGFLNIRIRPWLRRLMTRSIALVPAVIVIAIMGSQGTFRLLILSQVVLSLQLPFATIPLIHFTSDRKKMGAFASPGWVKAAAWAVAGVIVALNLKLVFDVFAGWLSVESAWPWIVVIPLMSILLGVLGYVVLAPLFGRGRLWESGVVTSGQQVASRIHPVKYRHIAVAVEHREGDADVISAALALVKAHGARLTVLHVTETPGTLVYGAEERSRHEREDQAYLLELAREIEERDLPVETTLRYGKPVEEIVKAVDEEGYDLLVLGSHGHHALGDIVFGETVSSVRHAVQISVMVIRTRPAKSEKPQKG